MNLPHPGRLGRLGRLAPRVALVALASGCTGNGQTPRVADPFEVPGLEEMVGWYRMPAGDTALLTFSATGGLRLFALRDTLYWATLAPGSDGRLRWEDGGHPVEWERADGAITGFSWSPRPGELRPAARLPDDPYRVEEASVTVGDVRLSGSLLVPTAPRAPVPAAVMIHGSGASDRDNAWYMMIADWLARHEIAVLLPDKRGSGKSEGDWFSTGLQGFAEDAAAWLNLVRSHPAVDPARTGLVGLSQGGRVAPMASARSTAAFVVGISGAAVPLDEQVVHEVEQAMKRDRLPGILDPVIRRISLSRIRQRRPDWWEINGPIDPLDHWRTVEVPALVVYGEDDELDNVPVRRSVERLRSLDMDDLDVWVFEGSGHALWEPEGSGHVQTDGRRRVRADLLNRLVRWIHEVRPAG